MNKPAAVLGIILIFVAGFLFLVTYSGGQFDNFVITGTNPTADFLAFLFVIVFLPIGSGLAFFGLSYRPPIMAAGSQVVYKGSSSVAWAAVAIAIIGILVGAGALAMFATTESSQNSEISSLTTQVSQLKASPAASLNQAPTTIAFKVDWCNTDPTGEDRFCPPSLFVPQGDTVQILFITNDTDAHTFTLLPATPGLPYSFQLNNTYGAPNSSGNYSTSGNGMHNFLTNGYFQSSCTDGSYSQESAGVSSTYCVSGYSLLNPNGAQFRIAQNPGPANSLNGTNVILLNITDAFTLVSENASAPSPYTGAPPYDASWSIAEFQATTPGVYEYICHYHVSNGMFGYMIVMPNAYCTANATAAAACGVTTSSG
jgi:plastocyanin